MNKVCLKFVKDCRMVKHEYEEFKVQTNAVLNKV